MSTQQHNEPKVVKVPPPVTTEITATNPVELPDNEIEAQIAAAHRHPRSMRKFLAEATEMATLTEDIAEACLYRLERWDPKLNKKVTLIGGSIRLAEICLSAWGNCHAGARPVEEAHQYVRAQGVCWDVERNVRVTMEATRNITKTDGGRYTLDMIITTMNAAAAIALRNAIFKIIPIALVDEVLEAAKKASVGELTTKRAKVIKRLAAYGATLERVLGSLGRTAIEEITISDLKILIASGSALKEGDRNVDELFPPLAPASQAAAAQAQPGTATASAGREEMPASTAVPSPRETTAETAKPVAAVPSSTKPRQGTLADVASRGRKPAPAAEKNVDDVIGGPRLASVPPEDDEEAANRRNAEPTPEEMAKLPQGKDSDLPAWAEPTE